MGNKWPCEISDRTIHDYPIRMNFTAKIVSDQIEDKVIYYYIRLRTPASNHILIRESYSKLEVFIETVEEQTGVSIPKFPRRSALIRNNVSSHYRQ